MAIFDSWHADRDFYEKPRPEALHFDVSYWPLPSQQQSKVYTLRLEELTHYNVQDRVKARTRNMNRLQRAQERQDILHLDVHYTCCVDQVQRDAIEALVQHDARDWRSFTMMGINGIGDLYASPNATSENLFILFMALHHFAILNLRSCTLNRGHGLECILKAVPHFVRLQVLRLEGWQIDRVTVTALMESLRFQHRKTISYLSMRSCRFVGEGTFMHVVNGLVAVESLTTLNLSYCNLTDAEIIPLTNALQSHSMVTAVHLGGNCCRSQESVKTIAAWIRKPSCTLLDLNLRSLWIGFSEEGLLQRVVSLEPLFDAVSENQNISRLHLSENYLENRDISRLTASCLARSRNNLIFLDVADNPFGEKGAQQLMELVQNVSSIRKIRFENHFMDYRCAELVKLLAEFNQYHHSLLHKTINIGLPLWPHALAQLQLQNDDDDEYYPAQRRAANHLFRLLRASAGPHGHELSLQISTHKNQNKV